MLKSAVIRTSFFIHHVSTKDLASVSQIILSRLVVACSSNSKLNFLSVCLKFQYINIRLRQKSLLNCVPCVLKTCPRANVPCVLTCSRALRTYVLTCQRGLRAHVTTCLARLLAHVTTCYF